MTAPDDRPASPPADVIIHDAGCSWETGPDCNCGADPERISPADQPREGANQMSEQTLEQRIRAEAAIADRPGQMQRLEAIADEVARLQRGAKTLGHIIEQQGRMVLDVTGRHDLIGEDGDGDWGAVWDHLYELPARAWDEGHAASERDWKLTFDITTPDEARQPLANPYRAEVSR